MNRLRFLLARTLRDEPALAALSVPQAELLAAAAGRDIALVGNARSLATQRHGAAIDAAGLVVRINRAPMPAPESHGSRTDWLALAVRLPDADRDRLRPGRILWMSPKRKRLDLRTAASPVSTCIRWRITEPWRRNWAHRPAPAPWRSSCCCGPDPPA